MNASFSKNKNGWIIDTNDIKKSLTESSEPALYNSKKLHS